MIENETFSPNTQVGQFGRGWTSKDSLLYSVGVGAGDNPFEELAFTTENSVGVEQEVLPTFATLFQDWDFLPEEFDLRRTVHAQQKVELHHPLPPEGSAEVVETLKGVFNKGSGTLVEVEFAMAGDDGSALATVTSALFFRGLEKSDAPRGAKATWELPSTEPTKVVSYKTARGQALLYRLSGDHTPIHSDPVSAKKAGFEEPILMGSCTFGFVGRALLQGLCDGDQRKFGAMGARFANVVIPGDTIDVLMWADDEGAKFQARVGERVVLDHGEFEFAA